ncbi:hypothetical protein C8Q80DRAFT_1265298 [Daedaleopsis nitida]|nr:hypothetical protein C8Q80DRAFT_1265298 [Daedaleopsis nitida]
MHLDARGILSAVEVVIYVPILIIGGFLSFKNGFARKAGWIFLVTLSIFRIVGGVAHILSEQDPTNVTKRTIYTTMESAGISQLLLATLGFLGTVAQYTISDTPFVSRGLKLLGVVGAGALVLGVIGGSDASKAKTPTDLDDANMLRHIGSLLYVVLYVGSALMTFYYWSNANRILRYRRQLLKGVTATLPSISVRVAFGALSSFAPSPFEVRDGEVVPVPPDYSGLGKLNLSSPYWGLYVALSVLPEYIAILIYAVVGIATPLGKDMPDYAKPEHLEPDSPRQSMGGGGYAGGGLLRPFLASRRF